MLSRAPQQTQIDVVVWTLLATTIAILVATGDGQRPSPITPISPAASAGHPVCSSRSVKGGPTCSVCVSCCRDWLSGPDKRQACQDCVAAECDAPSVCDPANCNVCPECCAAEKSEAHLCRDCVSKHCKQLPRGDRRCAAGPYDCDATYDHDNVPLTNLSSYAAYGSSSWLLEGTDMTVNTSSACTEECLSNCWQRPWSRCLRDCTTCQGGHKLTFAVVMPFLGRLALDTIFGKVKKKVKSSCGCTDKSKERLEKHLLEMSSSVNGESPEEELTNAEKDLQATQAELLSLTQQRAAIEEQSVQTREQLESTQWQAQQAERAAHAANAVRDDSNTDGKKFLNKLSLGVIGTAEADRQTARAAKERLSSAFEGVLEATVDATQADGDLETIQVELKSKCEMELRNKKAVQDAKNRIRNHKERAAKIEAANAELEAPGYTMRDLCEPQNKFADALKKNGQQDQKGLAYISSILRLMFWHWLQPVLYFIVFKCDADQIDPLQFKLGVAVAVREALYFLSTLICVITNPDFLLIDVMASKRDKYFEESNSSFRHDLNGKLTTGWGFVVMYVLSPEKFVAWATFDKGGIGRGWLWSIFLFGGTLLDICGIAALVVGLQAANLRTPLAIGYGATALGGVGFLLLVLQVLIKRCFRPCCDRNRGS